MSVDISVSITEDVVDIIANPTVNIVNVTNSASIDPSLYDLSEFTNTSLNPFVRTSGLSSYVPTSRTLTINGTTQDLSADRTFTISTGITIGTTAIASGTVGRVLFEGAGNVVQESANLFWDNTNGRLGIGTSSPTAPLQITTSGLVTALYINTGNDGGFTAQNNGTLAVNRTTQVRLVNGSTIFGANDRTYQLVNIGKGTTDADFYVQYWNGASYLERFRVFSTGNVGIGTTTDAGFKLDVNGNARVQNTATIIGTNPFLFINNTSSGLMGVGYQKDGVDQAYTGIASSAGAGIIGSLQHDYFIRSLGRRILFSTTGGAVQAMLFSTGNFAINTTTDAGFKLDVNGTARATQITATTTGGSFNVGSVNVLDFGDGLRIGYSSTVSKISLFTNSGTQGLQVNNGSVSIGPQLTPNASAILDLTSTTKGFLLPRMTTTQRNAIASPAAGLMVFDTTLNVVMYYNGTMWI